jgi:hypothetical protein
MKTQKKHFCFCHLQIGSNQQADLRQPQRNEKARTHWCMKEVSSA